MHVHAHGEGEGEEKNLQGLRTPFELSLVILAVEVVGAFLSRSLALTVDAIHNVPDILAFGVSLSTLRATAKGPYGAFTFGTHRMEVFAGLFTATLVLGAGLTFGFEAVIGLRSSASFAGPVDAITKAILDVPGVTRVHDVHVWSVCSTLVCLTAYVEVPDMPLRTSLAVVRQLREKMEKEFGILHATFEVECPSVG